jgi:TonB family protein
MPPLTKPMLAVAARVCCVLAASSPHLGLANPLTRSPNDRAQREAENPLRIIIEASRLPRKPAPDKPVVVAPPPARKPDASTAAPARLDGAKAGAPNPAGRAGTAPHVANAPPIERPGAGDTALLQAETPAEPASAVAAAQQAGPPPAQGEPAGNPAMRLLHMVEPDVPEHLWRRLGAGAEYKVRLWIEPDGRVSDARLDASAPEGLEAPVKSAVTRWRFSALPRAAQAVVTLVFRREEER